MASVGAVVVAVTATPGFADTRIDWDEARDFWSFRPPVLPGLPDVKGGGWVRNGIDRFLLHLMGIDHPKLNYHLASRHFRLSEDHGNVVEGILA